MTSIVEAEGGVGGVGVAGSAICLFGGAPLLFGLAFGLQWLSSGGDPGWMVSGLPTRLCRARSRGELPSIPTSMHMLSSPLASLLMATSAFSLHQPQPLTWRVVKPFGAVLEWEGLHPSH